MFITALCPTFRAPTLLANSLACWLLQDYPLKKRCLVILDDAGTFQNDTLVGEKDVPLVGVPWAGHRTIDPTACDLSPLSCGAVARGWVLYSSPTRLATISAKYNWMIGASPVQTDAFLVWEQDDFYLPSFVSTHAAALSAGEYSKPSRVLSDYPGKIVEENAAGRFHSSIAFRRELIERIGGWPNTKRADFDQQLTGSLQKHAKGIIDPWPTGPIPFVYRWHSGHAHGQNTMRSPDDETWYDRAEQSFAKVPFVGKLEPKMDEATKSIFVQLGCACALHGECQAKKKLPGVHVCDGGDEQQAELTSQSGTP